MRRLFAAPASVHALFSQILPVFLPLPPTAPFHLTTLTKLSSPLHLSHYFQATPVLSPCPGGGLSSLSLLVLEAFGPFADVLFLKDGQPPLPPPLFLPSLISNDPISNPGVSIILFYFILFLPPLTDMSRAPVLNPLPHRTRLWQSVSGGLNFSWRNRASSCITCSPAGRHPLALKDHASASPPRSPSLRPQQEPSLPMPQTLPSSHTTLQQRRLAAAAIFPDRPFTCPPSSRLLHRPALVA